MTRAPDNSQLSRVWWWIFPLLKWQTNITPSTPRLIAASSHFSRNTIFWLRQELKEWQCSFFRPVLVCLAQQIFFVACHHNTGTKIQRLQIAQIINRYFIFSKRTKFYLLNDKIRNILSTAPFMSSSRITCYNTSRYVHWLWLSLGTQCQVLSPGSSKVSKYLITASIFNSSLFHLICFWREQALEHTCTLERKVLRKIP